MCFSLPPHVGPGDAPKGASPGLGGGANPFFCVISCCQNLKICECLLAMPSFQCIRGGSVPPPITCRTLGWVARRKARRLALVEAPIFFFVSYCVGKTLNSVNVFLECPIFNALGAVVCRPQSLVRRWAGQRDERHIAWPWLWQSYYSLSPSVSTALPQAGPGASPGLGCGNLIVHFHYVFPLHCHKLGRAFRLALAEANILFISSLPLYYHAALASVKCFHSTALNL